MISLAWVMSGAVISMVSATCRLNARKPLWASVSRMPEVMLLNRTAVFSSLAPPAAADRGAEEPRPEHDVEVARLERRRAAHGVVDAVLAVGVEGDEALHARQHASELDPGLQGRALAHVDGVVDEVGAGLEDLGGRAVGAAVVDADDVRTLLEDVLHHREITSSSLNTGMTNATSCTSRAYKNEPDRPPRRRRPGRGCRRHARPAGQKAVSNACRRRSPGRRGRAGCQDLGADQDVAPTRVDALSLAAPDELLASG